jgi:hypothetical protein
MIRLTKLFIALSIKSLLLSLELKNMAHINSIGAAMFTDLSVATGVITANVAVPSSAPTMPADPTLIANFAPLFVDETTLVAGSFRRVRNARTFPAIGTPANIVKVPVFGQKVSQTIQGQSDAPSLEVTVNYIPADWAAGAAGTVMGNMVGDATSRPWRFTLLQTDSTATGGTKYATSATGLGTVSNSQFFFYGKLESLLVNTSLTDAATATLAFSLQSAFFGAYTS